MPRAARLPRGAALQGERELDTEDQEIRSWSTIKLELLGKYLHADSTIMRAQKRRGWLRSYFYVDAFSGVGRYRDPDLQTFVDGSPLVALGCEPPFDEYYFIELMAGRLRDLEHRVREDYPNHRVHFIRGDANAALRERIPNRRRDERGLVFLDPYGLQVDFATLQHLATQKMFDVFVNFSVMGVARNLKTKQSPDARTTDLLTRVMGDADLINEAYVMQTSFFDGPVGRRRRLRARDLAIRYSESVKRLFGFGSEPVLIRNSKRAPLYAVFLASHNQSAGNIANDIFTRYERLRQQAP